MNCAAVKCSETLASPVFACFGPCGRVFHAKCVGSTNSFLDKINSSQIAYWYCADCKKLSLSFLAVKMSNFKLDISKLSKGFEELVQIFKNSVSNLESYASPYVAVEKSTSTDDLMPVINNDENNIDTLMLPSISGINSKRTRDDSIPMGNIPCPPAKRKNLRSNSNSKRNEGEPKTSNKDNGSVSEVQKNIVVKETVSVPELVPLIDGVPVEAVPVPLSINVPVEAVPVSLNVIVPVEAVPKPKSIFVSRLRPDLNANDILHYFNSKNITCGNIKCKKISKPDSFVSSFKIFAPPLVFDSILNPKTWPEGTLVKEFSNRNNKRSITKSDSNPVSKN